MLGLLAYLGAFYAWYAFGSTADAQRTTVTDAAYLPLNAAAVGLALWAAASPRLPRASRRVWLWVALAYVARSWGDGIWFWLEGLQHVDPFPSPADIGYSAFYPLMLAALLGVPTQARIGRDRLRLICELLAVVGAGWMALWALVIGPTAETGLRLDLGTVLSVAYPLADLSLVAAVASVALRRPVRHARSLFVPLALAMVLFIAADTSFAILSLHDTWTGGQLPDVFWLGALAMTVYAPVRQMEVAGRSGIDDDVWGVRERVGWARPATPTRRCWSARRCCGGTRQVTPSPASVGCSSV